MIDRDFDMTQIMHVKLQNVSDSLHKLADRFDQANENIDTTWLNATSIELQRIAWNSLFVRSTIETLVNFLSSDKLTTDNCPFAEIFWSILNSFHSKFAVFTAIFPKYALGSHESDKYAASKPKIHPFASGKNRTLDIFKV